MKVIRFDRLKKLAEHLKKGQLGHAQFDFSIYNANRKDGKLEVDIDGCGTSGCAIGECPIVFPKDWEFLHGMPLLKGIWEGKAIEVSESGRKFFGINTRQYEHLFMPEMQRTDLYGGCDLNDDATKEQVADNIMAFCEVMHNPTHEPAKTTEP